MSIDWEREIEKTAETPADALREVLADADALDYVCIIASYKPDSGHENAGLVLLQSSTTNTAIKLGLLRYGQLLLEDATRVER